MSRSRSTSSQTSIAPSAASSDRAHFARGAEPTTDTSPITAQQLNTPPTDDESTHNSATNLSPRPPPAAGGFKQPVQNEEYLEPTKSEPQIQTSSYFPTPPGRSHVHVSPLRGDWTEEKASEQAENPEASQYTAEMLEESAEEEIQAPEWDFTLPEVYPSTNSISGLGSGSGFEVSHLVEITQRGADLQTIQNYLEYCEKRTVRGKINEEVEGFPAMFYAVATNNERIIRTWVAFGGDVNAVHEDSGVPLLAFTIIHGEVIQDDTTRALATLLSLGATPNSIPSAFYTPFCRDLPEDGPDEKELGDLGDEDKKWCTTTARTRLAKTANLTHRYYLQRASKTKKPSTRHRQIALRRNAEALLGIPYFLIGQTVAANLLLKKLLSHIMLPSRRPLVLVFAGPSGRRKTGVARSLGHLLTLDLEVVDCTIYSREQELFGPRAPWAEWEKGSPLNNFLARKAGERCIVFLDEFEKTSRDIHQTLLLPFDSGNVNRTLLLVANTEH